MKNFFVFLLTLTFAWLAWLAWYPPAPTHTIHNVRMALPDIEPLDAGPWRILTRRMVWKQAVDDMQKRLNEAGLPAEIIQTREPIELHAFDDPRTFNTFADAGIAKDVWEKQGIDADIAKLEENGITTYRITLGRFYLTEYAERMQEELKKSQHAYIYDRRTTELPSYRFAFSAMSKSEAAILWKRLENIGLAEPVIIQESEFKKLYGNKAANLSNK